MFFPKNLRFFNGGSGWVSYIHGNALFYWKQYTLIAVSFHCEFMQSECSLKSCAQYITIMVQKVILKVTVTSE